MLCRGTLRNLQYFRWLGNPWAQEQSGKYVFVAFDWLDTYDAETKKTMKGYCALELSLDGNELFGHV